jgi:hypothetical protein
MTINDDRIREFAEHALALANNDPLRAIRMLCETGLSPEAAFAAIDELVTTHEAIDEVRPLDLDELVNQGSEEDSL